MVRPTQELSVRVLTDVESLSIGDGTDTGDDGIDFDGGAGTGGGGGSGVITPPAAEIVEVITDAASELDIDFDTANWWDITLTEDCTFTFSNPPATGTIGLLHLIIRQGTGAPFLVTWPAEVEWDDGTGHPGGAAPTLNDTDGARDFIEILTEDGGISYGGSDASGGTGGSTTYGTPALTLGTANAAGSIDESIRRDATILAFDATAPVTQAFGDSAAVGAATVAARRDHKHGMPANPTPSFATPSIALSTAAAAGAAATVIRSDSTIAAFDATVPVTQASGDAAATGSAAFAARRDHKHGMPTLVALSASTPVQDGGSGSAGSGTAASKDDHKHPGDTVAIKCVIDGGGSVISTGVKVDISVPFACTITGQRVLADQSGSIVLDIWKDTYANYPPTNADSITASAKPTLSSATKTEDTTLTGWTTSVSAGDTLRVNVDSVTTITRVELTLKATRT